MGVTVFGSVALDRIEIGDWVYEEVLGGSGVYAALAASLFVRPVHLVWGVGEDFPREYLELLADRIDVSCLRVDGAIETFRWHGRYSREDESERETVWLTDELSMGYEVWMNEEARGAEWLVLATSVPELQKEALSLWRGGRVVADTIDTWIKRKRSLVEEVFRGCWGVCVNEHEARLLTGLSWASAARRMRKGYGVSMAVVKAGRYGAAADVHGRWVVAPGFPLEKVVDPTGAGDVLLGALVGYLAGCGGCDGVAVREGLLCGVAAASFCCESVGAVEFASIKRQDVLRRVAEILSFIGAQQSDRLRRLNYREEKNGP